MGPFLRSTVVCLILQSAKASNLHLRHLQSTSDNSPSSSNTQNNSGLASGIVFFVAVTACILWCCGPSMLGCLKQCCVSRSFGSNRRRPTSAEIQQQELENAIDYMIQRSDEADRLRSTVSFLNFMSQSTEMTSTWEARRLEKRKSYINRNLQTKKYVPDEDPKGGIMEDQHSTIDTAGDEEYVLPPMARSGEDERISSNNDDFTGTRKTTEESASEDTKKDGKGEEEDDSSCRVEESLTTVPPQDDIVSEADSQTGREKNVCVICFAEYEPGAEIAWSENDQCQHVFHRDCIVEWLLKKDECPCCRNTFMVFTEEDNAAQDPNNPQSFPSLFAPPMYSGSGVREFLGDDDSYENSLPIQLLRGLEILYRVRTLSETPVPPLSGPPVSRDTRSISVLPTSQESMPQDTSTNDRQLEVEMVNHTQESGEGASSRTGISDGGTQDTNATQAPEYASDSRDPSLGPNESATPEEQSNSESASNANPSHENAIIDT